MIGWAVGLLLSLVACIEAEVVDSRSAHAPQNAVDQGLGRLSGTVMHYAYGPRRPDDQPRPAAGARVEIRFEDGQVVKILTSDDRGRFSTRLPAGRYRVRPLPSIKKGEGLAVTIRAGKDTAVQFQLDIGIR